jgi:lipid-binding SYLF domain-containing protein
MKLMVPFRLPALALLFSLLAVLPFSDRRATAADSLDEAQTLVLKSQAVFKSFMNDPGMVWFHENVGAARGILIVPQMLRGGFIVGGSGGSGALLVRDRSSGSWSYPAFYTIGSLSLGLQIGADASELVLLIMTDRGLNAMLSTEIKAGADISIAAGPLGRNAKAQTADVLAFGRAKGAFGGVSIEGAVIEPRDFWNSAYYGARISPLDILMRRTARNPQAEQLRSLMPGSRTQQPQPLPYQSGYQSDEFSNPAPRPSPLQDYPDREDYGPAPKKAWQNPDHSWRNPDQPQNMP